MDNPEKFYITTPIYYVNARPHIGHTYTTVVCDAIARRQRMMGATPGSSPAPTSTGRRSSARPPPPAARRRSSPTRSPANSAALWDRMGITYDDFIRTTEPRHVRGVQAMFTRLQERGYIYKGSYSGQYCVFDELYVDAAGPGAPCPECGRPDRNRARRELLLQAVGDGRAPAEVLRRATRLHSSGDPAQRGDRLRAQRAARSLGQPHLVQVGHSGAGRSQARHLCLAGCAGQLHDGDRLRLRRSQPTRRNWSATGRPTCT